MMVLAMVLAALSVAFVGLVWFTTRVVAERDRARCALAKKTRLIGEARLAVVQDPNLRRATTVRRLALLVGEEEDPDG